MILRLRSWATQIEADLQREYRIDIADWHHGVLSSRRLLVLLNELSDESAYRREFERDGGWPVWQQMLKHLTNETALHRAGLYAGGDNAYDAQVFVDPAEIRARAVEAQQRDEFHEEAETQLFNSLGWT